MSKLKDFSEKEEKKYGSKRKSQFAYLLLQLIKIQIMAKWCLLSGP
jgi:hypothetical protein